MPRLSAEQRNYLREATSRYHTALPGSPAEHHLTERGLTGPGAADAVARFRLGFVAEPLPGHGRYAGMLAIPYMRWSPGLGWSVVSMRFRCVVPGCEHSGHGKYMSVAGEQSRMYNTLAIQATDDWIAITEGEMDAITATISGVPAVGIPGAQLWREHFREPFLGYESVYILADGDEAGMEFADTVRADLPNGRIIPFPKGEDVSSTVVKHGKSALLERLKH